MHNANNANVGWTREMVLALLAENPRAVERGLVAIYNRQTADEQVEGVARAQNGRGFNGRDAAFGGVLARDVLAGKTLRGRALEIARRMCRTYVGQLVQEAAGKPVPPHYAARFAPTVVDSAPDFAGFSEV
jgi:hypothetical protein